MRIEPTAITGVALIHWDVMNDERGGFARTYCGETMARAGLPFAVVQANTSFNTAAGTLRGMHHQADPHGEPKIVSCAIGRIFDVAVDVRPGSPTYRHWFGVELGRGVPLALHLASGIAHGFLTLEADSEVTYLMGAPYVPGGGRGLRWDDPAIGIDWPASPAVISDRDAGFALLELGK